MPNVWIEPELFLEYKGVAVYHCYDDDGMVSDYYYTTDPSDDNIDWSNDEGQFDATELSTWTRGASIADVIKKAIEAGEIAGYPRDRKNKEWIILGGDLVTLIRAARFTIEAATEDDFSQETVSKLFNLVRRYGSDEGLADGLEDLEKYWFQQKENDDES